MPIFTPANFGDHPYETSVEVPNSTLFCSTAPRVSGDELALLSNNFLDCFAEGPLEAVRAAYSWPDHNGLECANVAEPV
jgi:hypothetical protein